MGIDNDYVYKYLHVYNKNIIELSKKFADNFVTLLNMLNWNHFNNSWNI